MTDEVRATASTGAQKGRKPQRYSLVPMGAIGEIAEVFAFGSEKYDDHNWRKGYPWSWSYDAMMRHFAAWWEGREGDGGLDPESGYSHLAHAAWHAIVLLWFKEHYPEGDDRP